MRATKKEMITWNVESLRISLVNLSSDMMISFKYHVEKNIGQDETVCYEEKYIMEMMRKKEGKSGGTGRWKSW